MKVLEFGLAYHLIHMDKDIHSFFAIVLYVPETCASVTCSSRSVYELYEQRCPK